MSRAPLLSPSDAAKELCISEKQLRSLTCAGAIRYINIGLGEKRETRRYDPVDLEAFREARARALLPPPAPVFEETGPSSAVLHRLACPPDAGRHGSKASYIYFILAGGKVKIGRARSIKARMNALQSGCPYPVHLVHFEIGGEREERRFHKRFTAHHDRLEWFRLEGALEEYLRGVRQ